MEGYTTVNITLKIVAPKNMKINTEATASMPARITPDGTLVFLDKSTN